MTDRMVLVVMVMMVILSWIGIWLAILYPLQTMVGIAAIAWITMMIVGGRGKKGDW